MMFHERTGKKDWEEACVPPFTELIFTWNGQRPVDQDYRFYVNIKVGTVWSPDLLYAQWGRESQCTFSQTVDNFPVRSDQDTIEILDGHQADGFRIRVEGPGESLFSLHVYTKQREAQDAEFGGVASVELPLKGLSQMVLEHPRFASLCSAASSTAVIRYLLSSDHWDPIFFAERSRDFCFDIFGNWVLNLAHASSVISPSWECWVERLAGFGELYRKLSSGVPVVVSVRGPLNGSALPYQSGHLLVVRGYDAESQKVLCMDPAFPSPEETFVSYALSDFLFAWKRRGYVSYIFSQVE